MTYSPAPGLLRYGSRDFRHECRIERARESDGLGEARRSFGQNAMQSLVVYDRRYFQSCLVSNEFLNPVCFLRPF